jgi:hypothetical protein
MTSVLDHLILLCSEGAPEADEHVRLGLTEGSRNTHPGQGTANRRFFFDNAYLEFVWLSNLAELESEPARRLGFLERWLGGRCPALYLLSTQFAAVVAHRVQYASRE